METTKLLLHNEKNLEIHLDFELAEKALSSVEENEECHFQFVEVAFVDEQEIVEVNEQYLGKNYITDIITFRYDEDETRGAVEATLFCCAPRIIEQAEELSETKEREFLRIFIHGLLHLAGYNDQTKEEEKTIRNRENFYLNEILS